MTLRSNERESTCLWPQAETKSSAGKYSTKRSLSTGGTNERFLFTCYFTIRKPESNDREWPAAEEPLDQLHWQPKRQAARISKDLTSSHTHCLLGMDSKQEVQPAQRPRKAHCHQLHFNNFKGSPPPSFPQQNVTLQHFLTDVHKIPQWPHASCCCSSESSLGLELAAVKGRFTQLLVSLRSQSWIIAAEAVQWFSDKIIYCQKKKKVDLVKQHLAEMHQLWWSISWKTPWVGFSSENRMLGEKNPLQNIKEAQKYLRLSWYD